MIQFNFKNDFERFIDITIYIYGIHLIHKEEDKQMHMKLNLNEFEKYKTKTFEVFQKKIEEEVKKYIIIKIKENCLNVVEISKKYNIHLSNVIQCLFINNKINHIKIEWSSSSLKEFLYVPIKHYLIYFEDNLILKTKKIKFDYDN